MRYTCWCETASHALKIDLEPSMNVNLTFSQLLKYRSSGPLKYWQDCQDMLSGYHHMVFVNDCYSKRTRATTTGKITSMHPEAIFLDSWILPYGNSNYLSSLNCSCLVRKLFTTSCFFWRAKKLTTITYRVQTNRYIERHNHALVPRSHHWPSEHREG